MLKCKLKNICPKVLFGIFSKTKRPSMTILLLALLFIPLLVHGAEGPTRAIFVNPDFEAGADGWRARGGQVGIETCCGQHETPFWGDEQSPYIPGSTPPYDSDTWDGYIKPKGQVTALHQLQTVAGGQKYRLSTWFFGRNMAGWLYFKSSVTGTTYCASSKSQFEPASCEFVPSQSEEMEFGLEGNAGKRAWVVSDDWALTRIVNPLRNDTPKWITLPVTYYGDSNSYPTRTDIAAASWNDAMGKQMLKRTANKDQADIQVKGRNLGPINMPYANWYKPYPAGGQPYGILEVNKDYLDAWIDPPFRFGFEAREGIIAHEFGHALGLKHVSSDNCQLMQPIGHVQTWFCAVFEPTSAEVAAVRAIYP